VPRTKPRNLYQYHYIQLSLFEQQDLAEISSPDYPGERLIACRNPLLASERASQREELLQATELELDKKETRFPISAFIARSLLREVTTIFKSNQLNYLQ